MNKKKVFIDTDPGIDDILAIYYALEDKNIDILGISTVFGNVSLDKTTRNIELFLNIIESDIPIYRGCSTPLNSDREKNFATVHGEDGLGGLSDKYYKPRKDRKILELEDLAKEIIKNKPVSIISIGPLTNLAVLIDNWPEVKECIEEIHIMGGGIKLGNVKKNIEFNFYSDSLAAKKIIESDIKKYIATLDLTHKIQFNKKDIEYNIDHSKAQKFVIDTIGYYIDKDPYLHDICSVMSLTNPEIFYTTKKDVSIIISDDDNLDGMSILRESADRNTYILDVVDKNNILELISERLNINNI